MEEDNFQKGIRLEDYISKAQAAEIFQKTTRTIQNWLDEGKFPGAIKVAGQWFIPKSNIDSALEIKEVLPMKHEMTKEELVSAFEAIIEKRDTDLAGSMALIIKEVQAENLKKIEEIHQENQEIRNKLEKENQELRMQIKNSYEHVNDSAKRAEERDNKVMEAIRVVQAAVQKQNNRPWWKKLLGK